MGKKVQSARAAAWRNYKRSCRAAQRAVAIGDYCRAAKCVIAADSWYLKHDALLGR